MWTDRIGYKYVSLKKLATDTFDYDNVVISFLFTFFKVINGTSEPLETVIQLANMDFHLQWNHAGFHLNTTFKCLKIRMGYGRVLIKTIFCSIYFRYSFSFKKLDSDMYASASIRMGGKESSIASVPLLASAEMGPFFFGLPTWEA